MSTLASYIQRREDEFYVGDSHVTAQTVVANWKRGAAPEEIQAAFPSLSLAAVYGALAYYLEHQEELDAHFRQTAEILAAHQAAVEAQRPEFFEDIRARLAAHRAQRDASERDQSRR
jgi:hypothetical protein